MDDIDAEVAKIAVECALYALDTDVLSIDDYNTASIWGSSKLPLPIETIPVKYVIDTNAVQFRLRCVENLLGKVMQTTNDMQLAVTQINAMVKNVEDMSYNMRQMRDPSNEQKRPHSR
jgi:hypothetical protein